MITSPSNRLGDITIINSDLIINISQRSLLAFVVSHT
jgi:hypothetical protein